MHYLLSSVNVAYPLLLPYLFQLTVLCACVDWPQYPVCSAGV